MDLQYSLASTLSFLLKNKNIRPKVYLERNLITSADFADFNDQSQTIVIESTLPTLATLPTKPTKEISSTGTGENLLTAFMRSLLEFGEEIIRHQYQLKSRSGIAGGFFKQGIIQRAKAELVERDAFLHHYQQKTPMIYLNSVVVETKKIELYLMNSAIPSFKTVFAIEKEKLHSKLPYIQFGTGCSLDLSQSANKAIRELLNTSLYIQKNTAALIAKTQTHPSDPYFHHVLAIFDPRNIKIFNYICQQTHSPKKFEVQRNQSNQHWKLISLRSPFLFFKYYQAINNKLKEITYGEKEITGCFHPYW